MELNTCHIGDCRALLKEMAAAGVRAQTCVTSPPYWALRDYGAAGQIGLEPTLGEWVETMVDVFRAVRDVLADDGTLWLNLGDSYNAGTNAPRKPSATADHGGWTEPELHLRRNSAALKPKDMLGQPWRVAFALQADGWYLRSDIIWHKPNPMPESVTDRPTKTHEYLFLLSKSDRYYYDAEAIKEPASPDTHARYARGRSSTHKYADGGPGNQTIAKGFDHMRKPGVNPKAAAEGSGIRNNESFSAAVKDIVEDRNKRTVWVVSNEPYSGAHFATFPTALVEPCVLAGSRKGDVVLDPFMGSGTTAQVAEHLGRQWVGCELQPDYLPLQAKRLQQRAMAF